MKMFSSLKLYTCIYLRRNHQCKQNNSKAGDLIFLLLSILLKVAHFNALIEISVHFSGMFYIFIILYAFVFFLNSIRKCLKIYTKYRREREKKTAVYKMMKRDANKYMNILCILTKRWIIIVYIFALLHSLRLHLNWLPFAFSTSQSSKANK